MGFYDSYEEREELRERLRNAKSPIERAKWKAELDLHDLVHESIERQYSNYNYSSLHDSIMSTIKEKQRADELWELKHGSNYIQPTCDIKQERYTNLDQITKDQEKICKKLSKAKSKGDYDKVKEYYSCLSNLQDEVEDLIWRR